VRAAFTGDPASCLIAVAGAIMYADDCRGAAISWRDRIRRACGKDGHDIQGGRIMKHTKSLPGIGALIMLVLCTLAIYSGCQTNKKSANQQSDSSKHSVPGKKFSQVVLKVNYDVPTVGISEYTLITDDLEARRKDAEAIMLRKKDMPLAVQRHDAALFNSWLARDFIARGEHEFLGSREEYIQDRVNATWTVLDARYENLVLQFFGENALLTYRNIVKEKDEKGVPTTWLYTWADVWVKEDGEWKVAAIYVIDSKKLAN
jgi:ketosteroid isomerase-like protein